MIGGLLEGAAFLAARVQLKLKHEFPEFTNNLLEQLVPNYLAPTPSALLAQVEPPIRRSRPARGRARSRAAPISMRPISSASAASPAATACGADITLWPFEITAAEYIPAPGPLQALGLRGRRRGCWRACA